MSPWVSFLHTAALYCMYSLHTTVLCITLKNTVFSVCLPGNGQCSPGKENSRVLVDMSTPNGETDHQGPHSPSGECSINRNMLMRYSNSLRTLTVSPLNNFCCVFFGLQQSVLGEGDVFLVLLFRSRLSLRNFRCLNIHQDWANENQQNRKTWSLCLALPYFCEVTLHATLSQ